LISFKLETNEELLIDKAYKALEKTKSDYIVANILSERYNKVYLVNNIEKITIFKENSNNIEERIVDKIVELHNKFILINK